MNRYAGLTLTLAEWAETRTWAGASEEERASSLASLVDTVGVAVAGASHPAATIARDMMIRTTQPGEAQVWGHPVRLQAGSAAYANGVASHVLDFDDVHHLIHGHPSCVLFSALIAAAQERDLPGFRVLDGYLSGIGIMSAVSALYGSTHYGDGWHSTATCGSVGAAAGVAAMLDLGPEGIAGAMGAAVSMASGVRANFGTMMKSAHVGYAARAGVEAALLVDSGFSSSTAALESGVGGLSVFGAGRSQDEPPTVAELVDIADSGLHGKGIKLYPCCGGSHFAIDAAIDVNTELGSTPIESVRVDIPMGARTALIHDNPKDGLEAKFSLPYTVAVALLRGAPTLSDFSDEVVSGGEVQSVMELIDVVEEDAVGDSSGSMDARYAVVTVVAKDGRTISCRTDHVRGSSDRPLSASVIDSKFTSCVGPDDSDQWLRQLRGLDQLATARGLDISSTVGVAG